MQHEKYADQHQRVAHAEHVRARPAGGDGEDVAEECDVGVLNEIRVRELAGADVKAGGTEGGSRRRHHASVGGDGDEVQEPAEGDHPEEAQLREVPEDAGAREGVGEEVRKTMERLVAGGYDGHEQHLDRERHDDQPDPPDPHLLEATQPSARHREGEQ